MRVLAHTTRNARMLVVRPVPGRGPRWLTDTDASLTLARRAGCPVVVVPASWKQCLLDCKVAVGLIVVGSHLGPLPVDPVARRSIAAMICPVAILPHHVTAAERERQEKLCDARRGAR